MARDVVFFMMAFRFSVLLQLNSCTYVYNYFSENARIKFIPTDADVSGVVMAYFCFIRHLGTNAKFDLLRTS